MKATLASIICMCIILAFISLSSGFQSVGEDYGTAWLEKYGTKPVSTMEIANSLWSWGRAPKGFGLHEGVLYPPGTEPQWYYPTSYADYTPIIINRSDSRSSAYQNYLNTDAWLLSQLSGRPVVLVKEPKGTLF
jgi:hypothetical protein